MKRTPRNQITQDQLRAIIHYDPQTGLFKWLIPVKGPQKEYAGSHRKRKDGSMGYVMIYVGGIPYAAHRLAVLYMTGKWPEHDVDHWDLNKSNNAWDNLRDATRQQNSHNIGLRKDSGSGVRGVSWHKRERKWQAYISDPATKRRIYLGMFKDKSVAIDVRQKAEAELFGEFRYQKAA